MKRLFGILLLLFVVNIFTANSQDYVNLWSEVKRLEKNDLPKSVVNKSMEIFKIAQKNRNSGQMMKAFLTYMQYRTYISKDSFKIDINYLDNWAKETASQKEKAVLYSILGSLTIDSNLQDGFNYIKESLKDKNLLLESGIKDFIPIIHTGTFSSKYFNDNLYNLLSRQAIEILKENVQRVKENQTERIDKSVNSINEFMGYKITPASEYDFKAEILSIYQNLLVDYANDKYRDAWLLTAIDALTYLNYNYPLSLTKADYLNQLRLWSRIYYKEEACAAVYLSLANEDMNEDKPLEAYRLVIDAIMRYPEYEGIDELRNLEKQIVNPAITINVPVLYPTIQDSIKIRYKNIKKIYLGIYRINLPVTSSLLSDGDGLEKKLQEYGHLVQKKIYRLKPTNDYKLKDTIFPIAIKSPGIYFIRTTEDNGHRQKNGTIVYVSSLKVINRPLPDKKMEIIVVNAKDGYPVPYATFNVYDRVGNKYNIVKRYNADNHGVAVIENAGGIYYNVSYPKDEAMPISNMWARSYGYNNNKDIKEYVKVFTDRSIYKPGQRIYVGGFAYRQENDSASAISEKSLEATLYDSNRNKVASRNITTNSFGSFGCEFSLPQNTLTGRFSLSVDKASTSFMVEEYKQPTFSVDFNSYAKSYNVNDTIMVEGVAKTYTDVPLQNSKVKYTINRSQLWRWNNSSKSWSGETITDDKGEFKIPVSLIVDEASLKGKSWYYNFSVEAQVTNNSGETETGEINIPLTYSALMVNIRGLDKIMLKENNDSISFEVMNMSRKMLKRKVAYSVYQKNQSSKEDKRVVAKGEYQSNVKFIPSDINLLPDGSYILEVAVTDDNGKVAKESTDFVLISKNSKRPPVFIKDLFYKTSDTFNGNMPVDIFIGSSCKEVYLYYSLFSGDKRLENKTFVLNDSIMKFSYPYKKEYGDGLLASFAFMKDGKLYNHNVKIEKSKPDNSLIMKWSSFRDKLTPGSKEEWKLKVLYPDGKAADAQILATMFDASLNSVYKHDWDFKINYNRFIPYTSWSTQNYSGKWIIFDFPLNLYSYDDDEYNKLWIPSMYINTMTPMLMYSRSNIKGSLKTNDLQVMYKAPVVEKNIATLSFNDALSSTQKYRSDFAETAFFYPFIETDDKGEATVSFTLPQSLTTWQFMAIAHTKEMYYTDLQSTVIASKKFMVQPNMPRFVRVGDETQIEASVINLSDKNIDGDVTIELFNPVTDKVISKQTKKFNLDSSSNGKVSFGFKVNDNENFLACRIIAEGDGYSDGEQRIIPVLSDKQWMTESIPVNIVDKGDYRYDLNKMFNGNSSTATNKRITIEFTSNPIWYAIQALPVISMPSANNTYTYALAYYANSLSKYIVNSNPKVKQILDSWSKGNNSNKDGFLSNLEKNSELKNIILSETPWVAEAQNEKEQKERLMTLFDLNTFEARNSSILQKLVSFQNADGSWSWYKGMNESRYITMQVTELMARLKSIIGDKMAWEEKEAYQKAVAYLTREMEMEYENMKKLKKGEADSYSVPIEMLQYLYIATIDKSITVNIDMKNYYIKRMIKAPSKLNIYEKSLVALILYDNNREEEAYEQLKSIIQYSIYSKTKGRYFDTEKADYSYSSYKIPTQTSVIEAMEKISDDAKLVNEMKQWLLSQKQVQQWNSPIATANAVYALMLNEDSLQLSGKKDDVRILVNNRRIQNSDNWKVEGYVKYTISDSANKVSNVSIVKENNGVSWGAIYAQYLESLSEIKTAGNSLNIVKTLYKNGKRVGANDYFNVGDKITVRLTFSTDIDMDFVNIKDGLAACMQPKDNLSGYQWNRNVSYYKAIGNASVSFFVDRLRKGEYIIEYDVFIDRPGEYRTGICNIQSAYAPEFIGYGKSMQLNVK